MNVLVLAPYPFYQDRGSPIALGVFLKVLTERGDRLDVVVYHEGRDVGYANVTLHRIPRIPFINHIRPGFSGKKIICDLVMFVKTFNLVLKNHYHVVHAVEESVFMALTLKWLFKIPYIYDMDSSLPQQLVEKYPCLWILLRLFNFFEGLAVRNAIAVVPVCGALADSIARYHPRKVVILQDVSFLKGAALSPANRASCAVDICKRRSE